MIVIKSGRRVRVAWRRGGRLHFSEGIVVLGKVVSPVCVESYFVIIVKGEGAIWCSRHVERLGRGDFKNTAAW